MASLRLTALRWSFFDDDDDDGADYDADDYDDDDDDDGGADHDAGDDGDDDAYDGDYGLTDCWWPAWSWQLQGDISSFCQVL